MKKTKVTRSLLAACSIVALTAVMYGCIHSGDSTPTATADPEPVTPVEPVEPAPPTDLEDTQTAAAAAETAAMTASTNAAASSKSAMDATMNLATLQTGEMAGMYAMNAEKYAATAATEAGKAKAASDAAAAATLASAAGAAKGDAEAAQAAAESAAKMAADYAMKAADAAKMELMISGKAKNVGESMLNAGDGMLTTTDDDGKTTAITGRQDGDPMNTVVAKVGQAGAQDNPNTNADEAKTPMAAVAAMDVTIGRTLDSRDDMARLMLVTHYAGSKMVKVFDYAEDTANANTEESGGVLTSIGGSPPATADAPVSLTYKGMYYLATGTTDNDLVADDDDANSPASESDTVRDDPATEDADEAAPMRVYSYKVGSADPVYVVLHSSTTEAGKTTNTYRRVDVTVTLPMVPDPGTADDIRLPVKDVSVMAELPTAKAYDHIHFGVWAGLKENADGDNSAIADLGIGFVQNHSGGGMTGTMPNQGMATYNGDWAATIQGASEGAISLQHGAAMLTADLDKSTLTAALSGLATLSGAIDGSTFSGTKAAVATGDPHGLNTGGTFTGSFGGGFYGDKAVEAGGVFDFTSTDIADGAFSGAFGGKRDMN